MDPEREPRGPPGTPILEPEIDHGGDRRLGTHFATILKPFWEFFWDDFMIIFITFLDFSLASLDILISLSNLMAL